MMSTERPKFAGTAIPLNIDAFATNLAHLARAVLRAPLVDLRLLVETPAAWVPTLAAGLLAALAWWHDRSDRTAPRWQHIWWRRARTSFATSIPVLVGVWFLAVQLMLRAHAWRPHPGPPLGGLPVDLIKTIPVEPVYFWAFWCSAAVSAASTFAVAYLLLKKESVQPAGQP